MSRITFSSNHQIIGFTTKRLGHKAVVRRSHTKKLFNSRDLSKYLMKRSQNVVSHTNVQNQLIIILIVVLVCYVWFNIHSTASILK